MTLRVFLEDSLATGRLGERLAHSMPASAVVFLRGELGAGKSSLARAFLRALGITGPIRSPTYSLIEHYQLAEGGALHLDLYRVAESAELEFLGLDELGDRARLWLVEWPEHGSAALPLPDLEIRLEVDGAGRQAELKGTSPLGELWLAAASKKAAPGASS